MNPGEVLVILGTLAPLGAFVATASTFRSPDKRTASYASALSILTFVVITAALLFLMFLFLTSDVGYDYVWWNTSSDLSTAYKIAGVWSSAEGSFLLWIWFMSLVLVVEVMLQPRRTYLSRKFHAAFQSSLSGILFMFMLLLLDMNLFRGTDPYARMLFPQGYGLEFSLQTPEMILHPPVVFAGYAFCIAALAAGISYYLTGDSKWHSISLPWARLAWIFLTLGIGIGAIWAYYVLGWGGYWAWDPVETSSLLPWLVVTAFLHTQLRNARKGEYAIVSPALGMASFVAVMFAAFTTRAGSIWTASVHAFGKSAGATAAARLSYLLQHDSTVLGIFTLMVALFAFTAFFAYSKYRATPRKEEEPEPERMSEYISDRNNMTLTVALLIVTSAVLLLLLFKNVNVSQSANYTEFNQKMSLFFVFLMVALSICLVWKSLGKERAFWLGAGMLVASIVLGVLAAGTGDFDWLVAFSLPSYVLAVFASAFKIAKSRVPGSARKTLQKLSPQIIHLGVSLVLVSFVISSNMQTFPADVLSTNDVKGTYLLVGEQVKVGDYSIRLVNLSYHPDSRFAGGIVVDEVRDAVIDILKSGDVVRRGAVLSDLYGHNASGDPVIPEVEVYIYKSVLSDLYINFQWIDSSTAFVQVKLVPMMNFLWAGFGLLVIGLAIRTSVWRYEPKEVEKEEKKEKAVPVEMKPQPPAKTDTDYEKLVEEELARFKEKRSK